MFHTLLKVCFLSSCLITISTPTPANIYDGVADGGQSSNPGVKLRITQKGLDYLNSILLYEMNQIIPRLHVDNLDQTQGQGHMRISNGRVTYFKPPSSQSFKLSPPDQIIWSSSGINIAFTGHVEGSFGRFADEGDADITANNFNFQISIQPIRQSNGQFGAKARDCTSDVEDLDYNLYNTGALGRILQNQKGAIIKRFRPKIGEYLCKQATRLIDQVANDQLAAIPTKIPLNRSAEQMFNRIGANGGNTGSAGSVNFFDIPAATGNGKDKNSEDKSREAQREMTKNITKHLMFDYSNIRDPNVLSSYVETYNKGEISYHGQGGTPFMPPSMHENSVQTDRMMYLLGSDYVANSMLFNAYSHDLLKTRISSDETPDFKSYLKSKCDDDSFLDFCLGSIIPEIQETFPDSQAEINLEALKAPALFFRKEGIVNLMGQGLVKLMASKNGQKRTMAVANLDMSAKGKMFIDNNRMKGNCSFDKFDVTIKENNLKGFNDKRQKEFINSSKQMMEVLINSYLKNGLQLPSMKEVKLRNPKLSIFERTARLESDVEADKDQLTKMAVAVIQKHGGRVEGY